MREINKIIIHCSATRPNIYIGAADIWRWHVNERGWSDIGYHYVIRRNGVIENGRPIEKIGAHTRGHNKDSIGVCLVGGVGYDGRPEFNYTRGQMCALESLVYEYVLEHLPVGISLSIHGHNEFSSKACPCFNVQEYFK